MPEPPADPIPETARACIALGSNLGDRAEHIFNALAAIGRIPNTRVLLSSTLHETAPVGPPQPNYLNAAATLQTALEPESLLGHLLGIERAEGRDRSSTDRWGPRTLDLDLLLYEREGVPVTLNSDRLTLPHPRMHERTFVLIPLAEIAHDHLHPTLNQTIADLLATAWSR